jgi:hypothetical protein
MSTQSTTRVFRPIAGKLFLLTALAAASLGALAAAAPEPPRAALAPPDPDSVVRVVFHIIHVRTGEPVPGWVVEATYTGVGPDPVWMGWTDEFGSVTFDLIEGPYSVRVFRDYPVWTTNIYVGPAADGDDGPMTVTIAVNPDLG